MLTVFDIDGVEMQRNIEKKMLGMKNHFDISGSIESGSGLYYKKTFIPDKDETHSDLF